ncbi:MAG: hypothetical protein ACRDOK_14365, partial [Streptosporangiaceae bacterium]
VEARIAHRPQGQFKAGVEQTHWQASQVWGFSSEQATAARSADSPAAAATAPADTAPADTAPADTAPADTMSPAPLSWPDRPTGLSGNGQAGPEQRAGRYFLAGSLAVFLAGLGTAAFIAGGEPQPQAPTPPVAPSVDVMVFPHGPVSDIGTAPPIVRPSSLRPRPALSAAHTAHTRT